MKLPNFLIIGAAKAGTSALYHYIKQHPQVYMPKQKELRFFSSIDNPEDNGPKVYKYDYVHSLEVYCQQFTKAENAIAVGEVSPQYLYYSKSASRIKTLIPNVKLIATLRNPTDRAYSSFLHAVRDWHEPIMDFEHALQQEDSRINFGWPMLFHYVNAGFYYKQLLPFYKLFDNNNLLIITFDELVNSPNEILRRIFSFLRVDETFMPDMTIKPNISGFPTSTKLHNLYMKLFHKKNLIRSLSTLVIPESARMRITTRLKYKNLSKISLNDEIRSFLVKKFTEDILFLQELIDKDMTKWINE